MRAAASTWPRATGPVDVDHEAEAATVGAHGREYVTHTHKIETAIINNIYRVPRK